MGICRRISPHVHCLSDGQEEDAGSKVEANRAGKGQHHASWQQGGGQQGGDTFDGFCHNCGVHGHRKAECPTLDKIMGNASGIGNENSILAMNRNNFSYKRELKSLFSNALGGKIADEGGKTRDEG